VCSHWCTHVCRHWCTHYVLIDCSCVQPLVVSGGDDCLIKLWSLLLEHPSPRHNAPSNASSPPANAPFSAAGARAGAGVGGEGQTYMRGGTQTRGETLTSESHTKGVRRLHDQRGGVGREEEGGKELGGGKGEVAAAAVQALQRGRWKCECVLRGHGGRIVSIAIGGCTGRLIASSDLLGQIRLWAGNISKMSRHLSNVLSPLKCLVTSQMSCHLSNVLSPLKCHVFFQKSVSYQI